MTAHLKINALRAYGYHGCKTIEREQGQWFEVDLELGGDFSNQTLGDDLAKSCDLDQVAKLTGEIVAGKRFGLLETLGEELCRRLLRQFSLESVRVAVRKPNPPVDYKVGYLEVEVFLTRADLK